MKVYKYIVEGYDDWIHKNFHFRGMKYYIPEPYNFGIFVLDNKIKYIEKQDKIDDFKNDYFGFNPTIYEIDMDEELIKKFKTILDKQEDIEKEKSELITQLHGNPDDLIKYEMVEKCFNNGLKLLKDNKYNESLIEFNKCIESDISQYKTISYYNIACAHSLLKNNDESIKYMKLSIENGYDNWLHALNDDDLNNIKYKQEFVDLIKEIDFKKRSYRSYKIESNRILLYRYFKQYDKNFDRKTMVEKLELQHLNSNKIVSNNINQNKTKNKTYFSSIFNIFKKRGN